MDTLNIARWQFGITTVYHFFFVPLTIGLAFIVAGFQTAWYRSRDERYLRLTKFFGKLFLINFAMGVVTGIVQEFQFGMNWSDYSRFVGDIFGAPLAMEGLLSFFLESTFIGLWIFGWDRLSARVHLLTIWMAAIGTFISAYFILAANSFMQHPVGYRLNPVTGRAELTDIWAVLTNKVALVTFPHTIAAAFLTGGAMVLGVSVWQLARHPTRDASSFRTAAKAGAIVVLLAATGVAVTGDRQAKVMTEVQPMKMASAEAQYETKSRAGFSIFTIGTLEGGDEVFSVRVPGLLSYLGKGTFNAEIEGINNIQAAYEAKYGPGDYTPNVPLTYWAFRLMIGIGMLAAVAAAWVLWLFHKGRLPKGTWWRRAAIVVPLTPLLGNSFGWIFTEMGRQPWIVFGLMPTSAGVSPSVGVTEVLISLIGFTLIYGFLAVIEVRLLLKTIGAGLPELPATPGSTDDPAPDSTDDEHRELAFAVLKGADTMELTTVWFILIAVLWIGYFVLEGFDFGVGILTRVLARNDTERRVLINTIGPVWDGNEVWVLVAGGATFAAFPEWYATLFSGFYLPLFLILISLIFRNVAFEYRGKRDDVSWRMWWDRAIFYGSLGPAVLWGVAFANIVRGVAIDQDKEYVGTFLDLLNPYTLVGGLVTLSLFVTHGAVFVSLKTTGEIHARARALALRTGIAAAVIALGFLGWTLDQRRGAELIGWFVVLAALAALCLVAAIAAIRAGREGWAFLGTAATIAFAVASLFVALFPNVMPSTLDAAYSLTTTNASSTHYTLMIMTWVAVIFTPVVIAYQTWSYIVFRRRISVHDIPAAPAAPTVERVPTST